MFRVGLRIDVDTYRGTREGVPNLLKRLEKHRVNGTFFFSVGPDNMGRHLWRLFRPDFFRKMWRTKAPSLYGWDILRRGTLWRGPLIGKELGHVLKAAAHGGHELGLHAWDHYRWQRHIDRMTGEVIHRELIQGCEMISESSGMAPVSSAAPGWRSTNEALLEKAKLPFHYNSDCRGTSIFYPVVNGQTLSQPQIPTTLPTYDEVLGRGGITRENYNQYLTSLMTPESLNVLTIHAEAEGGPCLDLFSEFLHQVRTRGGHFVPLGELLLPTMPMGRGMIVRQKLEGREGWLSAQQENSEANLD